MLNSESIEPKNSAENKQAAEQIGKDYIIKQPLQTTTGKKRPDGTRCEIGKIYLPKEWIGKHVILSTTWNDGETIPTPRKAHQRIIRNEWTPGQTITAIYRTVGPHNNGKESTAGYLFTPREWIGRDVLIRPAEAESTDGTENQPSESAAPQGAE